MLDGLEMVELSGLLNRIKGVKTDGYRLMQICATKIDESYELLYSFGRGYEMRHLKTVLQPGEHVPSITDMYEAAYLYENEIHDLFGISVDGINHDYKGALYRTETEAPFR